MDPALVFLALIIGALNVWFWRYRAGLSRKEREDLDREDKNEAGIW